MKKAVLATFVLLFAPMLMAQTPDPPPSDIKNHININTASPIKTEGAVPVKGEPHHTLILQNEYIRVFNVSLPPLDATLLHQHDFPYIYLMLGKTEVVSAVVGKPDVRLMLDDGATGYTPGGFAHIARTDAGIPFHNITVELLHPQGSPANLG